MRGRWTVSLGVALGLWVASAGADDSPWRPVREPGTPPALPAASASVPPPAATLGTPVATLGRPVPLHSAPVEVSDPLPPGTSLPPSRSRVIVAGYNPPAASLGPVYRAAPPDAEPPPVPPPGVPVAPPGGPPPIGGPPPVGGPSVPVIPGDNPYDCGGIPGPGPGPAPPPGGFFNRLGETFGIGGAGRTPLESDHAFDEFASPVTNPFQFEDPRSLTEVRPIFMFQSTPGSNPLFRGADVEFFGLQARVALTERFSIVMQELGWINIEPDHGGTPDASGVSEFQIGPKFTFLRNECTGTVAAAGLTFDVPIGPRKVFQDTGELTLRPYVSFAQKFGQSSYGTFNAMSTLGYNFATDNKRSDNLFSSWHLDYNVANLNKIYPFVELNWRWYTTNGKANGFNFEGGDLFNFGSTAVSGDNTLTLAPGVRYKFNECAQIGTAVEFPLLGRNKSSEDFRWTVDLIFRY